MNDRPVRWTIPAALSLDAVIAAIAAENPRAAKRIGERIVSATEHLARNPFFGRIGHVAGTREIALSDIPYVITYRVLDDEVQIARVVHAHRDWPRTL